TPPAGVWDMHSLAAVLLAGLVAVLPVALPGPEPSQDEPPTRETAPKAPGFTGAVRPLLNSYCFSCHNTSKRKGGLDLEQIHTEAAALELSDLWAKVGERLRGKEMPPESRKQPTEDEQQTLLAWVKHVAESQVDYDKLPREQLERLVA